MTDKIIDNPLDELFTDSISQVDPADLTSLLKPYIRINPETRRVLFTPDGMKITVRKKIILFLLVQKVMIMKELVEAEAVSPKEIKAGLGNSIPSGTIDVTIKRLSDIGILKGQDGKYFIPDFKFYLVKEIFNQNKKE